MADIVISRLELYPSAEEATGYVVGFSVSLGNAKSFYIDTVVDIKDEDDNIVVTSEDDAVEVAYEALKSDIETKTSELEAKSNLLGTFLHHLRQNKQLIYSKAIGEYKQKKFKGEYLLWILTKMK